MKLKDGRTLAYNAFQEEGEKGKKACIRFCISMGFRDAD
jgi:hypothetical protein